MDNYKD